MVAEFVSQSGAKPIFILPDLMRQHDQDFQSLQYTIHRLLLSTPFHPCIAAARRTLIPNECHEFMNVTNLSSSHHTMRAAAATVDSPSASMQRYRDVADAYSSYISAPTVQSPITGAPERRRMTNRSRAATGRPTPPVGLSRVSVFPTAPSLQTSDSPLPPPVTPFAGSGIPPPELREGLSVGRYYSSFTPERSEQDSPVVAVGSGHAANLATNAREGPFDPADALTHAMYWRERGYDDYDATMESILSRYPYVMGQEAEQSSTSATAPPSASDMGHPRSN